MHTSRVRTSALAVVAVVAASVFAAAPASAATLPDGQQITIASNEPSNRGQFYEASPADASLTAVGTGGAGGLLLLGVDVDDDGHGFAVASDLDSGDYGNGAWIFSADANTGLLTDPVQVTVAIPDLGREADSCRGIDYTAGVVYAACIISDSDGLWAMTVFGPIDPVTGVLVSEVEVDASRDSRFPYFTAIAKDPISGRLYGFSRAYSGGPVFSAWTLDADEGATVVTDIDNLPWGADFDRDGQLWITTEVAIDGGEPIHPALATLDLTDGSSPFLEPYTLGGTLLDSDAWVDSITVRGEAPAPAEPAPAEPALAETGVNQSPAVPLGAGALLLFGAVLAAGAAAMRRRSPES